MTADAATKVFVTRARTVGDAVAEAGVVVGAEDRTEPAAAATISPGVPIRVVRVSSRIAEFVWVVPAPTRVIPSPYLHRDESIEWMRGSVGRKRMSVRVVSENGVEAARTTLAQSWIATPVPRRVIRGIARAQRSYMLPGPLKVQRELRLKATAYTPRAEDNHPWPPGETATGLRASYGIAAVDPRVIRLGTPLYVKGYGYCIAADTGGAIRGKRIDLCFDDPVAAGMFGVKEVTVYLLGRSWPRERRAARNAPRARAAGGPRGAVDHAPRAP